ncbi:tripartite tricarboxylate transporter permease [Halegenticoccus tardaugens]|uniref:tripartite tricarboxylate transporter permease n=1 Tax=Halegenticoccus tardaugens TaxID=2071624 RepID=UPI00100B25F3|nr:tripartite tricarboxylate transporter permease [Halegenticoccus tardaugens]
MDPLDARLVFDPEFALGVVAFAFAGIALGTVSGLTPGLHANNFALLLASAAASVPGSPTFVAAAVLAAGVVHTFLDVVPALALGVPDAEMAPSALPGHRLVVAGRGREALRLSAVGSAGAVLVSIPLAIPITAVMTAAYPTVREHLGVVLAAVVGFLLLSEPTVRAAAGGTVAFGLSAALGAATLDLSPAAPLDAGGMLAPLFTGLFGAPVLLDALDGAGVPPQGDPNLTMPPRDLGLTALAGSVSGAIVGYLPGVSAAIASVLALPLVPGRSGARGFLVATSGANTANTVFALFALVSLGTPRTGVMVALDRLNAPRPLPLLLAVTALAAVAGFVLVIAVGDAYLRTVGRADYAALSLFVLAALVFVSYLFAGATGVAVFLVATALGLVPPRLGTRRVHLMGVLIGPLALGL